MKVRMMDYLIYIWNFSVAKVYMLCSIIYHFFFPAQLPEDFSTDSSTDSSCIVVQHTLKHLPAPILKTGRFGSHDFLRANEQGFNIAFPKINRAEVWLASQYNQGIEKPANKQKLVTGYQRYLLSYLGGTQPPSFSALMSI